MCTVCLGYSQFDLLLSVLYLPVGFLFINILYLFQPVTQPVSQVYIIFLFAHVASIYGHVASS